MPAALGLDIGSTIIKIAEFRGRKGRALAMVSNPLGKAELTTEAEINKLAGVIKKLMLENKIEGRRFKVVIPDSLVYSRVVNLPVLSDAELGSAIRWEAEQYIPIPLEEVELSWEVLDRPIRQVGDEKMKVFLVAVSKRIVNGLMAVFSKIGLEPERIEPEMVTVARMVILDKKLAGASMLCVMGASGVSIAVFEDERLLFVYRFGSGGQTLTKAIVSSLQLGLGQAEEYKRSYGVREEVLEGKLLAAMQPVLLGMVNEMKRAISYYAQLSVEARLGRVVISGGMALMPGLVEWLTRQLGTEVVLGDPFKGLGVSPEVAKLGVVYAPVVGAVMQT